MKTPRVSAWELRILQILLNQTMYGLQIKKEIKEIYEDEISEGTLYPTLHRMSKKGFLDSSWGDSSEDFKGARRKYYTISSEGVLIMRKFNLSQRSTGQLDHGNLAGIHTSQIIPS